MSDETIYAAFLRLYSIAWVPAAPFVGAALALRSDCRARWRELLAMGSRVPAATSGPRVWLHAVSVGELVSAVPVVERLRALWPGLSLRLTTTIQDAFEMADRQGLRRDWEGFLALDLPAPTRALARAIDPDIVLISETDLWPNMLEVLHGMDRPAFLINGRISYKIARGFGMVPRMARVMLNRMTCYLVQTDQDRVRLEALGVTPDRIVVTGNTKHEAALRALPPGPQTSVLEPIKASTRPVVVGGSTHTGEDAICLDLARQGKTPPLVVIAPRLIERGGAIAKEARARGLLVKCLSDGAISAADVEALDVLVVDRLGLLSSLYFVAWASFVGGSFDGSGGHNFLEAAAASCPVVVGSKMRNFHEEVVRFRQAGGLVQVDTPLAATRQLSAWLADRERARAVGESASAILRASQGAAERTVRSLVTWFPGRPGAVAVAPRTEPAR